MRRCSLVASVIVAVLGAGLLAGTASADPLLPFLPDPDTGEFAPLDQDGPDLSIPDDVLAASLHCSVPLDDLGDAEADPVLLLSGTTLDPPENFGWNYEPALTAAGIPWCTSTSPGRNMADVQVRGEYVVYAIRTMAGHADRDVALLGHSQGGMVGRWALRFWPDTRDLVSDVVGLAPSNDGTLAAVGVCAPTCAPSFWQQRTGSAFLAALNSGRQTFPGVDYTAVYTLTDEVVTPQPAGSDLADDGGDVTNVALQDVCPAHPADHLSTGTSDAVAWALTLDALTHDGPADPGRIDPSVCLAPFMPGVNPVTFPTDFAHAAAILADSAALYPHTPAEPPLARYVRPQA